MFSPVLYSNVIEDKFAKIKTENFSKQKFFLSIGSLENERFINFKTILEKEFRERERFHSNRTYLQKHITNG